MAWRRGEPQAPWLGADGVLTVPLPLPYALPAEGAPGAGAALTPPLEDFWVRPPYSSTPPASAAAAAEAAAATAAVDKRLGRDVHRLSHSAYGLEHAAPLRKALTDGDSWSSVVRELQQRAQRARQHE